MIFYRPTRSNRSSLSIEMSKLFFQLDLDGVLLQKLILAAENSMFFQQFLAIYSFDLYRIEFNRLLIHNMQIGKLL